MRRRSVLLLALGGTGLALAGAVAYARPLLETGTGYAAHNACAVAFVADRGADAADDDLPPNPLVPLLRTSVGEDDESARSSVLGLFGQTAWHTEGLGCVLAPERPVLEAPEPVREDGWPEVARDGRLDAAVDRAFDEGQAPVRWSSSQADGWSPSATPTGSTPAPASSAGRWARA